MAELNFLQVFERYGADTVLVSIIVLIGDWAFKRTRMSKLLPRPLLTVLPFVLGLVCFSVLHCISHGNVAVLWAHFPYILQCGFTAGCLCTLEEAVVSRFFAKNPLSKRAAVVRELIEEFAKEEQIDEIAVKISDCVGQEYSDQDVAAVIEVLKEYADEQSAESDLRLLAALIVETLKMTAQ
ncbi:MAG: hypothetical protein IKC91_05425 [Clostridia bacterium]|nr:hypothetical protein [Clostridia bacterium]